MNSRVRDFFRVETKDIVSFNNFDQIYYVFEQMILYDIDVPELEGLGERLPLALNKIATEKLDRDDVITFFPIVWGKFEPYARKILYIINPKEYEVVRKDKNSSIVTILDKMGIKVFLQKHERTNETDAIYSTYKIRNAEAHQCDTWSLRKCYDILANAMASFLIVTNRALPALQSAMENVSQDRKIELYDFKDLPKIKVDIFDHRFTGNLFFNLNEYFTGYRKIGDSSFDEEGWIISTEYVIDGEKTHIDYDYVKDCQRVIRQSERIIYTYEDNKPQRIEENDYRTYSYDDEDKLIKIEIYHRFSGRDAFTRSQIIEVEYLTDGGLKVTRLKCRMPHSDRKNEKGEEISIIDTRYFDRFGYLTSCVWKNSGIKYTCTYTSDGRLLQIKYPDKKHEVKRIGDNLFFIEKDDATPGILTIEGITRDVGFLFP